MDVRHRSKLECSSIDAFQALSSHTGPSSPNSRLPMMAVAYGSRSTEPCKTPISIYTS